MMEDNQKKAYQEMYVIISLMPENLVKKIPIKFRKLIEEQRDKNYVVNIHSREDFEKAKLLDETIIMLGMVYSHIKKGDSMKKIELGEIAVLDNGKEYTCIGTQEIENKNYVFLISNFKPVEIRFGIQKIVNDELEIEIVTDKETKNYLFQVFKDKIKM